MGKGFAAFALAAALGAVPLAAAAADRDRGSLLERLDLDGDGAIEREEARAFGDLGFQRLDRDEDGVVTEGEMFDAAQDRVADRAGKVFARMDRNGDGRVERAELAAWGDVLFRRADADGNGRVTVEEIRARWQSRRHRHEGEAQTVD